jgi:acyl-CoA synthetase (AMP-forming)/AMP-acid ligase II
VSWLPLYHDLGLILGTLTSLYARNDLHLTSPFQFIRDPLGWLCLLSEQRATHTVTPYFAINHCLNHLERGHDERSSRFDFEPLRSFLIGSDPIDFDRTLEFQRRLEPFGFRRRALVPAYGMAEAVLVVSSTALADEPWAHTLDDGRKLASTGHLLPGFEARITREDGSVCGDGELGQIELRGGTMAQGYFEDPAPFYNAAGFFETGDLAYCVRDELVIAGRAGDRIKVNGQTLFASDFEFATQSLPFVKPGQAVVFQLEDQIIVLAQLSNHVASPLQDCRQIVSTTIAKRLAVKLPTSQIHFIAPGQIKKTTSGKLKRRAIAQSFIDGTVRFVTSEPIIVPASFPTSA